MPRFGSGPTPARIMLVGECFNSYEVLSGEAFLGPAGQELNKMLHEAGIMRSECYTTNIVNDRPPQDDISQWIAFKRKDVTPAHVQYQDKMVLPVFKNGCDRLLREIAIVQPNIILAFGNIAMWVLTGAEGISKWRGSLLTMRSEEANSPKVIPLIPPYMVTKQWELRAVTVNDLRSAKRHSSSRAYKPLEWDFKVRPSHTTVLAILAMLQSRVEVGPTWLDFDLETRAGHIACAGISWSLTEALCIPFMCVESDNGYWEIEEEAGIVFALYKLLTHPNAWVRWQNGLYDAQYTYRHWHFVPNGKQDTMISHHTCFAGLSKSLAFQASMYCDHYIYWKDDGKTWNKNVGEDQLWSYNAVDCVRTRECGEVELTNIESMKLQTVEEFQQALFWPVLRAMQLGVRIDTTMRSAFANTLQIEMDNREALFKTYLGHALNPRSPLQMSKLFYEDLKQTPIKTRAKKGNPAHLTCDDEALQLMCKREPILIPLIKAINEYRSLGVFLSTFVLAKLDVDGRMRCSYNICGTETYRFNSSKNAFDSGTNLQNIPKGSDDPNALQLPNVRVLFVPDPGFTFFDMDLDRADLQVVVWEADEAELKDALRKGVDMHLLNAFALLNKDVDLDDLVEGTESCNRFKHDFKKERQLAKSFIHGTNYGGGPRTMSIAAGVSVAQAERFQKLYFGKYPGIKRWHERTEQQLRTTHSVSNILGYKRIYFDRIDGLLPEALAWQPQSTVACVINRAWLEIYKHLPQVQVLLQVHDSLAGQFPTHIAAALIPQIKQISQIVLPYADPLTIPVGIKTSTVSWGNCE